MGNGVYIRDKRAAALKAADARSLLNNTMPFVLQRLTEAEVSRVQKVLDAAVVNVSVNDEYQKLMEKAVIHRIAGQVNRDPRIVREADKVFRSAIRVSEEDKHIKLDYRRLLAPGALMPLSNNPDEAAYLEKVKQALDKNGIWLRFDYKAYKDPNEYTRTIRDDPRTFTAWLSYGYNGPAIDASFLGFISREDLLIAVEVGKGYLREVYHGPIQEGFRKIVSRLYVEIQDGIEEHGRLRRRDISAFPGVAEVSKFVGDADDLPDMSIWDLPSELLSKARKLNSLGKVMEAQPYIVLAALSVRNNALVLINYEEDTSSGAAKVVSGLKIVVQVSEDVMLAINVYQAAALLSGKATRYLVGKTVTTTQPEATINQIAENYLSEYIRANGSLGAEVASDLSRVRLVYGPKGQKLKGMKWWNKRYLDHGEFF